MKGEKDFVRRRRREGPQGLLQPLVLHLGSTTSGIAITLGLLENVLRPHTGPAGSEGQHESVCMSAVCFNQLSGDSHVYAS